MEDDYGPFNAIVEAATSPGSSPTVPGRPSIGMVPVVSTPTPSAPTGSGQTAMTAHIVQVKSQIAELRALGLEAEADRVQVALNRYIDEATANPSGATASGGGSSKAKHTPTTDANGSVSNQDKHMHTRDYEAMQSSFVSVVQNDAVVTALRHTVRPDPSQNACFMHAVGVLVNALRAVRPYGEDLANCIYHALPQLDPTPLIAADACVASNESTSWRLAAERLAPFTNVDRYRTVDGQAGDLSSHVQQLHAGYAAILQDDKGADRGALRALDRSMLAALYQVLDPSFSNVTPPVTAARNFVEFVTVVQRILRFGDAALYELLCRRLEEPVKVPVLVATPTPIYDFLVVLAALHDYRMRLHYLLHHHAAVRQLRRCLEILPTGTDALLTHNFQTAVQGLLQEAKRSDGSRSEVQYILQQQLEKQKGLEYKGDLCYPKANKSNSGSAAFMARTEQGGGKGSGRGGTRGGGKPASETEPPGGSRDAKTILCSYFQLHGHCAQSWKDRQGKTRTCPFSHSQAEQSAAPPKAEPAPTSGADPDRGRTSERAGDGKSTRPSSPSPWKDKCAAGKKCKGITDGSCKLWHPARDSPSTSPSPSRGSASSARASDIVRKAGFSGYVHVVDPPEPAYLNLATAVEADPPKRIQFCDVPTEPGAVPAPQQRDLSEAAFQTPVSSAMRQGPSDKFLPHPELPENLLTREGTRKFVADFKSRDVTSDWLKLTEYDRRCSVLQGFSWPAELNRVIASCLYYQLPVSAPIRNAWDRVVVKGSHCPLTKARTWFGEPPAADERELSQARVVDLSNLHSAVETAAEPGVYFVHAPADSTVFDSGCSPVALANRQHSGLRNIRPLLPTERFKVRGIGGDVMIKEEGELHFRVLSELYHADSVLRAELARLQGRLAREDPLFYYFVIPCFIDDDLPSGVTLVSLGKAVWNLGWRVQIDKDPTQCFGLSAVDSATDVRLKFSFSIGDPSNGSFGSTNSLLRMPGLELVPDGIDPVEAARASWAQVRVLSFQASENLAARNGAGLNVELAAYSLIGGYGFYAETEPDVEFPDPAAAKLLATPASRNVFQALETDATELDADEKPDTEHASGVQANRLELKFPKRLFNQLRKAAKAAELRRRQSSAFLMIESRASRMAVDQVIIGTSDGSLSSTVADSLSASEPDALSIVAAQPSPPAMTRLCPCCRLSLEAGDMFGAQDLGASVPVTEVQGFNKEAPKHSVSRSLSAFVSQQLLQFRSFEEAASGAIRDGTAVLLKSMPW